jgi:hypothetical protein
MKKIIIFFIAFVFTTSASKADNQGGSQNYLNIQVTPITPVQIQLDLTVGMNHGWTMPYIYNPLMGNFYLISNLTSTGYYITIVAKDLNTGDTAHFKLRACDIPFTTTTTRSSVNHKFTKTLMQCPHCSLDSTLYTGVELKTKKVINLPHPGKWSLMAITNHTPVSFRGKHYTNIDSTNNNPNTFLTYGVNTDNAMTVVGYSVFESSNLNSGVKMNEMDSDWKYFNNDVDNTFNLGITSLTSSDSVVVTLARTITSRIPTNPDTTGTLDYLFDTIKNVSFTNSYTLNHPFDCDTFRFDSNTQEVFFKTKKGTPQQVVSLNFKIEVYRVGFLVNTTYKEILCVINELAVTPNGITAANQNEISVYPNPAKDFLHVDGLKVEQKYEIITVNGILVNSGFVSSIQKQIDVRDLSSGKYLLKLENYKSIRLMKN